MPNRSRWVPDADSTIYLLKMHIYGVTYDLRDFRGNVELATCFMMLGFSTKLSPKYPGITYIP